MTPRTIFFGSSSCAGWSASRQVLFPLLFQCVFSWTKGAYKLRRRPGQYQGEWNAEKPGAYLAEVSAETAGSQPQQLGRDLITFQRENGVAENFHTEQNRHLLEQLASETGGRYWNPSELKNLPRDISYSEAGISVRTIKELWNMPIFFLFLLGLPTADWLLRRKWGVV